MNKTSKLSEVKWYPVNELDNVVLFEGNRDIKKGHVNDLGYSIETYGFIPEKEVILLSKDNDIKKGFNVVAEGNHRVMYCKQKNISFPYRVLEGVKNYKELVNYLLVFNCYQRPYNSYDLIKLLAEDSKEHKRALDIHKNYGFTIHDIAYCFVGGQRNKGGQKAYIINYFKLLDNTEKIIKKSKYVKDNISFKMPNSNIKRVLVLFFREHFAADEFHLTDQINKYPNMIGSDFQTEILYRKLVNLYNYKQQKGKIVANDYKKENGFKSKIKALSTNPTVQLAI